MAEWDEQHRHLSYPCHLARSRLIGMRVLVVEDDPDVADLIARALREAAWACDVVRTGAAALEAVAIYLYDAVVLDLGLPDMDGVDLCGRFRKRGATTPIIMLT